jgi:hypothetical protein
MKYFRLLDRLNAQNRYLIWISNERDAVVVDGSGSVPSFEVTGCLHGPLPEVRCHSDISVRYSIGEGFRVSKEGTQRGKVEETEL